MNLFCIIIYFLYIILYFNKWIIMIELFFKLGIKCKIEVLFNGMGQNRRVFSVYLPSLVMVARFASSREPPTPPTMESKLTTIKH
jgi:hypothetical protein